MDDQKDKVEERMDDIPERKRPASVDNPNSEMLTEIIENKSGRTMDTNKDPHQEEKSDIPREIPIISGPVPERRSYLSVYFIPLFSTLGLIVIVVSFILFYGKPPSGPQWFRDKSVTKKTVIVPTEETNTAPAAVTATNITSAPEVGNLMPTNEAVQERQRETVKKMKAYVNEIKTGSTTYTVRYRDSLWDLAKRNYGGNGFYWVFIYALNVDTIKNPDVLVTGTKIIVPTIPRDLLSTRLERIPASVRSGLAESYYEIYEIYIAVNENEHAKWMLYLSDRFDPQIIEMSKGSLPRTDYDFVLRARTREGR
ncbi:MAG: LysM peptidoglycan-binding domain-containing protein [Spirochaetota bacterium]